MTATENKPATFSIAIVAARFNTEVTDKLLEGAMQRLKELDFTEKQIRVVRVPGAVEIPIVAQRLAQQGIYSAIVALGAVIRGDTDHYEYVCSQVSDGCRHVSLQYDLPVLFGVLTTENEEQAFARCTEKNNKGREVIDAAIETVSVLKAIG